MRKIIVNNPEKFIDIPCKTNVFASEYNNYEFEKIGEAILYYNTDNILECAYTLHAGRIKSHILKNTNNYNFSFKHWSNGKLIGLYITLNKIENDEID